MPPQAKKDREVAISLEEAAGYILEECRMVLPGIQALFGFQLIAVFEHDFFELLSSTQQALHLGAIALVTLSIALVMSPAALHRQTQKTHISDRFIRVASRLLLAGMFPLLVAICMEVYLVAALIGGSPALAAFVALAIGAVFAVLWVVVPQYQRRKYA